ncbi:MAG: hypothetical protein IKW59_04595 [Clostridia bacterium]|nr:hypothetical protein [Clostridia bacterium]
MCKDNEKAKKIDTKAMSESLEDLSEKEIELLAEAYSLIDAFELLPIKKQAEILVELNEMEDADNHEDN